MNFIVLAGGEGERLGGDKPFIMLGGVSLLERVLSVVERAREPGEEVFIVKNGCFSGDIRGYHLVDDLWEGCGALGAIYTGILCSDSFYNFVLPCDTPFLSVNLIRHMRSHAKNYDVLIPAHSRGIEPLHAIYTKNCLLTVVRHIRKGDMRISAILGDMRVKEMSGIAQFGRPERIFFNVNTWGNLAEARSSVEYKHEEAANHG